MKKYLLKDILLLKSDFDLFDYCTARDQELLRRNMYTPLVIAPNLLVWGFSLLKQAQTYGLKELYCEELIETDIGTLLTIALKLENRAGHYSWHEKENIYNLLTAYNKIYLLEKIVFLIEKRKDPLFSKKIRKYIRLSPLQKGLINKGFMNLKTVFKVKALPELFFKKLEQNSESFTFRERHILAEYIQEVILRDRLKPAEQLKLIKKVFTAQKPLQEAYCRRFPRLWQMEKEFSQLKADVLKGSGIDLTAPLYFEGSSFSVQFSFNSPKSLDKRIRGLKTLKEHNHEFFRFLQ